MWNNVFYSFLCQIVQKVQKVLERIKRENCFSTSTLFGDRSVDVGKANNKSTKYYGLSECVHINDRHSKRGKNAFARFVVSGHKRIICVSHVMQTKKLMIRKNEKTVKTSEKKVVFRRRYVRDTAATRTLCAMKYLLRIFFSVDSLRESLRCGWIFT